LCAVFFRIIDTTLIDLAPTRFETDGVSRFAEMLIDGNDGCRRFDGSSWGVAEFTHPCNFVSFIDCPGVLQNCPWRSI